MANPFPIPGIPGFIPLIGNDRTSSSAFKIPVQVNQGGVQPIAPPGAGTVLGANNQNLGDFGGYTGPSGPATSAAPSGLTPQEAQQRVANQLAVYNANYAQQSQVLQSQLNDAQSSHDQQISQLQPYYDQQQHNLDSTKQQSDQALQQYLAGHGISDSTWGQQQANMANQAYQSQTAALHQDQIGKLQQIDEALQQAKNKMSLDRANIDISKFQSLDQFQQYLDQFNTANSQLNNQAAAVKNAILNSKNAIQSITANPSNSYNSANAQQQMIDNINKMIAAGTSQKDVRGYIQQGANKDELQNLLDYYQNVTGNQPAPAAPGLPAA